MDSFIQTQSTSHVCRTWAAVLCIVCVWLPLGVSFLALMSSGLGHAAFVGVIVICLFLAGACGALCNLGLVAMSCLFRLVVLQALLMLTGLRGCACLAIVVVWGLKGTSLSSVLPLLLYDLGMQICSRLALTPCGHVLLSLIIWGFSTVS